MKKYIVYIIALSACLFLLSGCGKQSVRTSSESERTDIQEKAGQDSEVDAVYSQVYDSYNKELQKYSHDRVEGNVDLKHNYIAIKNIFSEAWPQLIELSPYEFSDEGELCADKVSFTIKTYRERKNQSENLKILYANYAFIRSEERIKGYAIWYNQDGTVVLYKCASEYEESYTLLKKDNKDRFVTGDEISKQKNRVVIDGHNETEKAYQAAVDDLTGGIKYILLKDGEISGAIAAAIEKFPCESLNPYAAQILCQSQSVSKNSEKIDNKEMWKLFAGIYDSRTSEDEVGVQLTVEEDGSFTGIYKRVVYDTVENKNQKKEKKDASQSLDYAEFHGTFTNARKLDEYNYFVECENFTYDTGEDEVRDGILYKRCEPSELASFRQFKIYKVGSKLSDIPEEIGWWYEIYSFYQKEEVPERLDRNVIQNIYTNTFLYQ